MLIKIIQSFLPWILYFALQGDTPRRLELAVLAAAISSVIFEFKALKKGFVLSWGTLCFFSGMLIAVVLFKNNSLVKYSWILSNGALALIAWISFFIKQPFTLQYAKLQVSSDKWHHPIFLKINYILTGVWGSLFLFSTLYAIFRVYFLNSHDWIYELISYLPSIFGIWFTLKFPNWYKERYVLVTDNNNRILYDKN